MYRYAKCGGSAVTKGKLCQQAASGSDHIKDLAVAAAAAVGATTITITNGATTAITADMFKDGWVYVNDVDGEGQACRIKSNTAADTDASCTLTLYSDYALTTALTTDSQVGLRKNRYDSFVVNPTTPTGVPIGVTPRDFTASYYGWLQVSGPAAVLTHGTVVVGKTVVPSISNTPVAGAVESPVLTEGTPNTGANQPVVGWVMSVAASTEYSLIDLKIE